jgi:hypothetical protein
MKKRMCFLIVVFLLLLFSSTVSVIAQQKKTFTDYDTSVVLVTGFGPFHTYDINPSELITQNLSGEIINDALIVGIILPVDFDKSVEMIVQAIDHYEPVLVLSLGLSAKSTGIEVETFGINLKRFLFYCI